LQFHGSPPSVSVLLTAPCGNAHQQRDDERHEEHEEQDFRDTGGAGGDATEAQGPRRSKQWDEKYGCQ
jgi:hypothetical protein